jgi:hypothetical protein
MSIDSKTLALSPGSRVINKKKVPTTPAPKPKKVVEPQPSHTNSYNAINWILTLTKVAQPNPQPEPQNQNTIKPGVPISPILMAALLRYNGTVAQIAGQLSHMKPDHTATPTPFNTMPRFKPND